MSVVRAMRACTILSLLVFCSCQQDSSMTEQGQVGTPSDSGSAEASSSGSDSQGNSAQDCIFQSLRVTGKIKQSTGPFLAIGIFEDRDELRVNIQNTFSVGWGDVLVSVEACQTSCDGAPSIIAKGNLIIGVEPLVLKDRDGREVCTIH